MKTSSGFKLVVGLLIALLVLYVLMQIYLVTYPSYKTEIAVLFELSDEISAEGTVVRKETVSGDDSGIKYYLIADGDKVAKGEKVAEYYSDSDSAVRNLYIQRLKEELEILKGVSKGNRGDTNLSSICLQSDVRLFFLFCKRRLFRYFKAQERSHQLSVRI